MDQTQEDKMSKQHKILPWILRSIGAVVLALAVYYAVDLIWAYQATPAMVAASLPPEQAKLRFEDLTPWQEKALLMVEDPGFYKHHGIDLKTPGAGLTTITQGLAKKLYFHPFKPGLAKIRLMLLARWVVDPLIPKKEQMTMFLNLMYFGRHQGQPVVGFAAASEAYYGKPFQQLAENEFLSLLAMVIAPETFHLENHPEANVERTARIRALVDGKYHPKHLMDQYYGPLAATEQKGLAPASYFPGLYQDEKK